MVTCSTTPTTVLGPMGNLQGTHKFFSLLMGKKVKQSTFTLYLMTNLVIKNVKTYAKSTAFLGIFDFANRNGILFEWNQEVDKFPEGIVVVEDDVLYPSLAAEHSGVVLGQDQPLPLIEKELILQGHAGNADKLSGYAIDDAGSIIAMSDKPQQPSHAPLVVNNTDDNNIVESDDDNDNDDDTESNDNNKSDNNNNAKSGDDKLVDMAAATDLDGDESDGNKERKDCNAEEGASLISTPITVY